MDEISILRRVRSDIPERSPAAVASGRAELFAAIADSSEIGSSNVKKRRSAVQWVGAMALGAAALTVSLVGVNVFAPSSVGGADPAAASALGLAADAAIRTSDPVVPEGHYLLVETNAVYLSQGSITTQKGDLDDDDFATFLESYREKLFVPASRDGDWVVVQYAREPVGASTAKGEQLAQLLEGHDTDQLRILPAGTLPNGTQILAEYESLPRDPDALLETIYRLSGPGSGVRADERDDPQVRRSREGRAFTWIADVLRRGTVPADLRAALYETAAKISGVSITQEAATLDGSKGIAIGRVETSDNTRQDLIIDPQTGQFIGEREISLSGFGDVAPDTTTSWTTVSTSIIDSAPEALTDLSE